MPLTLNFSSTQLNGPGSLIGSQLQNNSPQSPYLFTIYHPNASNGSAYFNIGVQPNSNGNFSGSFSGSFSTGSFGFTGSLSGSSITSSGINLNGYVSSNYINSVVISQVTSSFQLSPLNVIPPNTLNVSGTGGIYLVIESNDA